MSATNDYFVRFDSNAKTFATQLESELKGARNVIKLLRNDIAYLNKDVTASGRLRARLAEEVGRPSRTGVQPSIDTSKLAGDMDRLDDSLTGLLGNLETVVGGLRLTANEIHEMPGKISAAVLSAIRSIKQHELQETGRGARVDPATGRIATPGPGTVPIQAKRDSAFAAAMAKAQQAASAKPTIAGTSKAVIEKAGVDRIVRAIKEQTKDLVRKGVGVRDTPTTPATVTTSAPKIDRAKIEREVRKLLATVGNVTEEAVEAAVNLAVGQAEAVAAAVPAKLSKAERKARAATARANRPSISDEDLRLVNSPGDAGFSERLGRKKDDYTLAELHQMADAYERLGIAVNRTARMPKGDLATNLKGAFGQFSQLYPGGAKDFQVGKTTKIPQETRELLGSFDQLEVEARQAAIALRQAHTAGVGRQPAPNYDRDGNAVPTHGRTSSPGIFPWDQVGSPVTRIGTPAELLATYKLLNSSATREMPRALAGAENPTFNPFDPTHRIQQGSTPGEKALADAMRARLRDIRLATVEVDKFGTDLASLNEAIARNERFIESAEARIARAQRAGIPVGPEAATGGLSDARLRKAGFANQLDDPKYGIDKLIRALATDPERSAQAQTQIRDDYARQYEDLMSRARAAGVNPASAGYQAAYDARTPDRQAFLEAERVRAEEATRNNVNTYRELRQALVEGVARVGDPKNRIPGLTYRKGELTASAGMSREDFAELKRSLSHLASVEEDTLRARAGGYHASYADNITGRTPEQEADLHDLERRFENAATRFAHRIEAINPKSRVAGGFEGHQISGGIAPTVEELIGRRPADERARAEDELRRTARDRTRADVKNPLETEEQKQVRLAAEITRAQRRLKEAKNKAAVAAEKLAREEAEAAAAFAGLTKAQQAEVLAHRRLADEAEERAKKAGRDFDALENLRNRYYAPTEGDVGPEDPTLRGEATRVGRQSKGGAQIPDVDFDAERQRLLNELSDARNTATREREAARRVGQEEYREGPSDADKKEIARLRRQATNSRKIIAAQDARAEQFQAELGALPPGSRTERGRRVNLDVEGNRAGTGAAPSVASEKKRLQGLLAEAEAASHAAQRSIDEGKQRIRGLSREDVRFRGPETDVRAQVGAAATNAARDVSRLEAELADLEKQAKKVAVAEDKEAKSKTALAKATEAVVRADNAAVTAKRQQIENLKAQGPHTQKELNPLLERRRALAKDDPAYADLDQEIKALQARKTKKHRLQKELRDLDAGGDGTGGTRTAAGAADGPGGNLLRQILAVLRGIHATIKSGVKVTETGEAGAKTTRTATTPRTAQTPVSSDAESLERVRQRRSQLRGLTADKLDDRVVEEQARATQRLVDADTKATAAQRNHARQAEVLGAALRVLNKDSRNEVETLRRLTAEYRAAAEGEEKLAAATRVANQQTKVATALDRDLGRQQVRATDRRQGIRAVLNDAGPKLGPGEFENILRSSSAGQAFSGQGEEWGQQMGYGAQDGFSRVFGGGSSFWGRVLHTTGTFVVRNFAAGFVFGLTNMMQQVLEQGLLAEQTFVRVRTALESTGKSLGNIRSDLQGISTDYGIQLNDVYEAAAGLAGLFENENDLAAGTRVVAMLQAISGGALNATEATGVLASTLSAFQRQAGDAADAKVLPEDNLAAVQHVADVLTSLQNTLGVNIETSAEGMSSLAGLAKQLQLSMEETATFSGQIAKQTNQSGAAAGEKLARILGAAQTARGRSAILGSFTGTEQGATEGDTSRIQTNSKKVRQALEQGNYGDVLRGMIAGWDDLSDAQKRNLIVSLGGQRQAASLTALMNDAADTLYSLERAENSQGEAADRMADLMETFNRRLGQFGSQVQTLASNLIQAGLLDFLGLVLVSATAVLDVVNKVLTAFNQFADSNSAIDKLRLLVAVLVGAALAFKALQVGARGFSGAIRQFSDVSTAARTYTEANRPPPPAGTSQRTTYDTRPGYRGFGRPAYGPLPERAGLFGSGGTFRAPITRGLAFGADRTVGTASSFVARQFTNLGNRLAPVNREALTLRERFGLLSQRVGAAATLGVDAGRRGLSQVGSGRSLLGGGLTGLSSKLNLESQLAAQRAAGQRSILADQNKYASYSGQTAAANRANLARQIAARGQDVGVRTGAPDSRLAASARANELVSRAAAGAATGTSKVAAGFSRIAASGALADGAMIALGIGITAVFSAIERNARAAASVRKGIDALTDTEEKADKKRKGRQKYVGPTTETLQNQNKELEDASWIGGGTALLGQALLHPLTNFETIARREVGLTDDGKEFQGTTFADDLIAGTQKKLQSVKDSGDEIDKAAEKAFEDIEAEAKRIGDSDDSKQQQQAAIANLERARAAISDQAAAMRAIADGAKSAIGLTGADVAAMQEYVSVVSSLNGQVNANGLDLQGLLQQLRADTGGAYATPELKAALEKIGDPTSSSIDILIANRKLLKEEIIQLQEQWRSKLESDPEAAEDIKSQLLATIQQYGASNDQIFDAITAQAASLSAEAEAGGNGDKAIAVYGDAAKKVARLFRKETNSMRREYVRVRRAWLAIAAQANRVDAMIGEGFGNFEIEPKNFKRGFNRGAAQAGRARQQRERMEGLFDAAFEKVIFNATKSITLQISRTVDEKERQALEAARTAIILGLVNAANNGVAIPGIPKNLYKFGPGAITPQEHLDAEVNNNQAQLAATQAAEDAGNTAAQNAAALRQAQLGVAQAWADARGDAVKSAQIQVAIAKATIAAARADLAAATTADETNAARISILNAQAQLIAAHAAVQAAQTDLVQSQYDVTIALAEAAGHTVEAARRTLAQARAGLASAIRKSGGKATAEVNAARVQAIQAEAALRDARLQDDLDTIDFNLEMGKMTQASAISALQEILKVRDLTRDQRRQLLLQIKGMKDELSDSQWNFGDIKLPTPYQMRRYIEERRTQFRGELQQAAGGQTAVSYGNDAQTVGSRTSTVHHSETTITIDGADIGMVRRIIKEVVGDSTAINTRTTAARRGGIH